METQDSKFQFYSPERVQELLGVRKSTYYKLLRTKLLRSSRLYPGGPRIHTQQQLDDYRDYLNTEGEVSRRIAESAQRVTRRLTAVRRAS